MTASQNPQPPPDWRDDEKLWEVLGLARPIEPSHGFVERTLRRLHNEPQPVPYPNRLWRWAWAGGLAFLCLAALVVYPQLERRHRAELYAATHQADYLEDFDVIAALHWMEDNP